MNKKIVIVYKSVTGFTKEYAEMIAQELNGLLIDFNNVIEPIDGDMLIFGSRMHAGRIDGLQDAKKWFEESSASQFLVFATGAMPNEEKDTIEEMWNNNFTAAELQHIPHFYMQSGLRYERMPLGDKMMMKMFCMMMRRKKNKDKKEQDFADSITKSYDISSKSYIMPLVEYVKMEK